MNADAICAHEFGAACLLVGAGVPDDGEHRHEREQNVDEQGVSGGEEAGGTRLVEA